MLPLLGDRGGEVVQQAGAVFGDDLDQGGGAGGSESNDAARFTDALRLGGTGLGRFRSSSRTSVLPRGHARRWPAGGPLRRDSAPGCAAGRRR